MPKKAKNNSKESRNHNISKTDLPDIKTNAQTNNQGKSMKQKLGEK